MFKITKLFGERALLAAIATTCAAEPAYAYIDPGTSSMVVQLIIGGIAAVVVMTRRLWQGTIQRMRGFGRTHPGATGQDATPPAPTESKG